MNKIQEIVSTRKPLLRWWLLVTLMIVSFAGAFSSGIVQNVYDVDITKLSFLILTVLAVMSIKCGIDTYKITLVKKFDTREFESHYAKAELGWFTSDLCLTLGMIGTVAGFIFMLSTSFASIDVSNISSLQNVLSKMSVGMATALYTTATGLISSAFLKLQYFSYSTEIDRLAVEYGHGEYSDKEEG